MVSGNLGILAYLVLAIPLFSFLINGLWIGRKNGTASAWMATILMGITGIIAVLLALGYYNQVLSRGDLFPNRTSIAWEHIWMGFHTDAGVFSAAKFGFYLDPISVMMILVITCISFLVHFYSIGYMHEDKGQGRFFPLLSFFTFTMLGLVVSTNLIQTFFFWELVGTASYLLIGFWYTKPAAIAASKKAFLLTRFADAFFLIGVLVLGLKAGSFDFQMINSPAVVLAMNHKIAIGFWSFNLLTLGTLLVYMGAWGKSAMFPFHVWLPDAMEGPTPVSSLIHSATMVVAGIYLTARLFPIFSVAEHTLAVVEFTGAFTAVFAAVIACTQTDLKRILAFSTLSQLGLMMFALGTGVPSVDGVVQTGSGIAFSGSLFHVFTHAFFKCLLFLSAGIVIHAIHSNDIRDAGGLRRFLPRTYWTTFIAVLAIAGIFPLSGFWSKDEILHTAFSNGHYGTFGAGILTSGLTAFYMSRYFFLIFHGKVQGHHSNAHEGWLMTIPLLLLAIPSALVGWLSKDFFLKNVLPWTLAAGQGFGAEGSGHGNAQWLPVVASVLALGGVSGGWFFYGIKKYKAGFAPGSEPLLFKVVYHKFYIDELYIFLMKTVGSRFIATPIAWIEKSVVNGAFDWFNIFIRRLASMQSIVQSGQVQFYIAIALLGLLTLAWFGVTGI